MAENIVSTLVPFGNQTDSVHIKFLNGQVPAVSSLDIAKHFCKKHQHVLRDINNLTQVLPASFCESNFGRTSTAIKQPNGGTREGCAYLLTRDAFSLLVMGFTGKAAIRWKLAYIEAFNALERQVSINRMEHQRLLELARESGYQQGHEEAQKLQKKQNSYTMTVRAIGYLQKGLTIAEAAKLCDISRSALESRIRRLRSGIASLRRVKPVQGNLMEVAS